MKRSIYALLLAVLMLAAVAVLAIVIDERVSAWVDADERPEPVEQVDFAPGTVPDTR